MTQWNKTLILYLKHDGKKTTLDLGVVESLEIEITLYLKLGDKTREDQ